ncbi:MAG: carboxypeptidase regulatory-like domain-containing protein, partial [Candidatus Uhrbacteria bacterium]
GDTSAWVIWDTDEQANSNVDYGLTESYEIGTESDGTFQINHALTLSGLTPGTLHYFQVRSSDNNGNQGTSSGYSFTTTDTTAPILSNIEVVDITTSSARVTWETDELTDSSVSYGIDETYGSEIDDDALSTEHSLILLSLDDDTEYHFIVSSTDGFGNVATSTDQTFTTLADDPPANVSNLSVVAGDAQNQLTWSNPADADLNGIYIVYKTDGYPISRYDGTPIFNGLAESYLHLGLVNGISYYYAVFAYDLAGQFSSGALGFGMPHATDEEDEDEDEDEEDDNQEGDEGEEDVPPDEAPEDESLPDEMPDDQDAYCGDGVCGQGEDYNFCPVDCPDFEQPADGIEEPDVEFWVAKNRLELIPANGLINLLAGTELQVRLDVSNISQSIDHIELVIGNDLYLLAADPEQSGEYFADVFTPTQSDTYYISITVYYLDDSGERLEYTAIVNSFGYTFEMIEGEAERVGDSTVTLFSNVNGIWQVWDASEYGQLNPLTTPADGSFAWYVPTGDYYVVAEKGGYDQVETDIAFVITGVVNPEIELQLLPPPLEEVIAVIVSDEPIFDRATEVIGMLGDQIGFVLKEIREIPGVVESAEIAVPVMIVASAISLGLMAMLFNLLPFLQYLFTAPLLFFWRRKRKGWGIVYNAVTKISIGLVVVRLYQLPDEPVVGVHPSGGRLLQTRVTDKEGRYFFLADKGTYRIQVVKPGFVFPHQYLHGVKDDGHYFDVYHGETIDVSEHGATIAANVPMMPEGATRLNTPKRVRLINIFRTIQKYAAVVGVLFAAFVCLIIPSIFTVSVAVAQVVIYLLVTHLTKVHKPKGWGIVYDEKNGQPLSNTVVRIFEPKYNKLLETAITDRKGRYSFLVGPNEYYTRYEHQGYQPFEYRPIDLKDKKEPTDVSIDVRLETNKK